MCLSAGHKVHLVRLETLDAAGLEGVVGVAEAKLTPLVAAEAEEAAALRHHGRVLVAARQTRHLKKGKYLRWP